MNPITKLFSTNPKDYRALRSEWFNIADIFDGWKNTLTDDEIQLSIQQVLSMGYIESVNIIDVEVVKPATSTDKATGDTTNETPSK